MSGYVSSCPSCGAELVFALGSSLFKVCDYCHVGVVRKGADLAAYGKVASLLPTNTVLKLGLRGDYEGAPPYTLVGRLQLQWEAGAWDEWLMGFEDGTFAWLSEAQGRYHYMGLQPLPPAPAWDDVRVGQTLDLGQTGVFVVSEVRKARFVAALGELPFDVEPGSELRYADLSGPQGQLATLDYGTGDTPEALFVGREITLAELKFEDLPTEEDRRVKTRGDNLSCRQCGGPIELRAPGETQRFACPYCGSLLDATRDFAVLEALESVPVKPVIPLGKKGRFGQQSWTAIGFMVRSTTVDGIVYSWREYLLYEAGRGFRWLVESNGHWSFVQAVAPGEVRAGHLMARCRGKEYKHFQGGMARVEHVLGEFYWAVARGDTAETADYVAPPEMLSMERTPEEVTWSLGHYLTPQEVKDAFALPALPSEPMGVGAIQPWPHEEAYRTAWPRAWLFLGLAFIVFVVLSIGGGQKVHQATVAIPNVRSATPESVAFLGPFEVKSQGNLEITVTAPVSNSWLYLDGALINEETGGVDEFDAEIAYYFGSDSDGSWSEGGSSETRYLPEVPPGRYTLRLAPQWEEPHRPAGYDVKLRSRVPRFWHLLLACLAIVAGPALLSWRRFAFEAQRWNESDHPWNSGGDDE